MLYSIKREPRHRKKNKSFRAHCSLWIFLHLAVFSLPLGAQTYPHVQSNYAYRVTNRKSISHLLFENINGAHYITFITSHSAYYNYKASSHFLRYRCGSAAQCLETMSKLNKFLITGYNMGLQLEGSNIVSIEYFYP